ncbi:hypothetical protein UFOVP157_39 [uncultured Caudovirales phage]|uniref:Uncharacterized protein n=1 Tax=uncultured Caudovirales phage TaxID=2100421 RepID=A0A6J7W988_9CAUD|nr:hypothetical protein UFOVP157_39 [uncultured Caudovirales phage]
MSKRDVPDAEIEVTFDSVTYTVGINFDTIEIDDSYNGDRYGDFYVFNSSHREIDKETIQIQYIESDLDYAIDHRTDISDELYDEIVSELMSKDLDL